MTTYTLTPPATNGSYDGDMIVKNYTSLTISSGNTLTASQPCRGMFLYINGDCNINGTLTMSARGALANPTVTGASDANAVSASGLQYGFFSSGINDSLTITNTLFNGCGNTVRTAIANAISGSGLNYKVASISRIGGTGGPKSVAVGSGGGYGSNISLGKGGTGLGLSGGGGGGGQGYGQTYANGGAGSAGTCFSGGSGGGGGGSGGGGNFSIKPGYDAIAYGGAGGQGGANDESSGTRPPGGGGAGNPGGVKGSPGNTSYAANGDPGTGGTLILVIGGNLNIGSTGKIESDGSIGGWAGTNGAVDANGYQVANGTNDNAAGGGGSGGGNILIIVKGTITVSGSIVSPGTFIGTAYSNKITAKGGRGGTGGNTQTGTWNAITNTYQGAFGGDGSIQIYQAM